MLTVHINTMGERMLHTLAPRCRTALVTAALVAALATSAATIVTPPANAALWMRTNCINPDQTAAPSDGWTGGAAGTVSVGSTNNTNCTTTLPMYAALSMQSPAAAGASEFLAYTPPPGSSLVGGSLLVGLAANGYGYRAAATAAMFTPAYQYDASNVFLQCVPLGLASCQNGIPEYHGVVTIPANKGGSLYLGAGCAGQLAGTYCSHGGSRGVWSSVAVAWANLLLSTSSLPTATDFRGSVLEPDAHGTANLAFAAADNGPGVYNVTVTVDGVAVYNNTPNTNGGKCVPVGTDAASGALMWAWQQPCPQTQTVDLLIGTTLLTDGEHELKVTLTNPAGGTSTVLRRTITTNNRTTVSGKLTSDKPVPPAGSSAPPAPVYAVELDAPTRQLVGGLRRSWASSALTLSGTLRNSLGVPAPGVLVTLFAQNAGAGAQPVTRTTTDAAGHWVLAAPRGPSRVLAISYGEQPDPAAASAIKIRQTVKPGLTLRVRALGRGRLRFTGRLQIKPLGTPRPLVVVQARNGRRWQAVGHAVRVSPSGSYTLLYNGGRSIVGGRYRFRAVAPSTRLFATGTSPIRRTVAR